MMPKNNEMSPEAKRRGAARKIPLGNHDNPYHVLPQSFGCLHLGNGQIITVRTGFDGLDVFIPIGMKVHRVDGEKLTIREDPSLVNQTSEKGGDG